MAGLILDFCRKGYLCAMKKLKLEELNRLSPEAFQAADKLPVVLVLDNVRSLHNVGSAFRTADAFRVEKIFLTGITGRPPHRDIQKTALGATDTVAWEYVESAAAAVQSLRQAGYQLVMVEQTTESVPLHEFMPDPTARYCLVFGNEVAGISDEVLAQADVALEIPQAGTKHSLNISVCLGIVSWEFFKRLSR